MEDNETGIQPQVFDYFLVLDFEATCDSSVQPRPQEIIEFPCLKVSGKTFEVDAKFHHYIRPTAHPELSSFCTDLTGIIQGMVEDQPDFPTVLQLFENWLTEQTIDINQLSSASGSKFAFVTCGDWDLKVMLLAQCQHLNMAVPAYFKQWINIKKEFGRVTGRFPRGMMQMMAYLDLEHKGRHHSGIDDCANIAEILKKLAEMGTVFDITGGDALVTE